MSTTAQESQARAAQKHRRDRLVLGMLTAALAGLVVHHTLTLPMPKNLVVAAPRQTRITADASMSFEKTLLERFAREHGVKLSFVFTDTPEEALDQVESGRAHIGLALGVAPSEAGEAAQREPGAKRKGRTKVAFGPEYDRQPIYAVDWDEGYLPPEAAGGSLGELLRVAASFSTSPREAPALPLDALHLLLPFISKVRDAAPTRHQASYRFAWRTDVPRLNESMQAFWSQVQADGTLPAVRERTQGFYPGDPDPVEMDLLRYNVANRLPPLNRTIKNAAAKWGLDPFLLVAVIHQESHFNPAAVSATGVRGLMQMTGDTLLELGVSDPGDAGQVIEAGARYLSTLRAQFTQMGYAEPEAMLLALAAFNVGQGHVQDAIELARKPGEQAPAWLRVRGVLPRLTELAWAQRTRYGLCRGGEAVDFVDKVRYFAFAARGLVLAAAQGDELAGLRLALAD